MNKVEKSSGEKLMSLGKSSVYSKHPTNRKFINLCVPENKLDLANASTSDVNKTIKLFNVNKAKGPDGISTKFVKMSASVIDCHLINIINNDILLKKYSKHAKTATIRPNFKRGGRTKIKNYCPASLLNIFSKIYERFLHRRSHKLRRQISFKIYFRLWQVLQFKSCINLLNRKLEKINVGAALLNLLKAFGSIPHDHLKAKMVSP